MELRRTPSGVTDVGDTVSSLTEAGAGSPLVETDRVPEAADEGVATPSATRVRRSPLDTESALASCTVAPPSLTVAGGRASICPVVSSIRE